MFRVANIQTKCQNLKIDFGIKYIFSYICNGFDKILVYYRVQNTQNRYSPIFIDITDGLNQREWFNSSLYPNDKIRVSGGIQLIESLVFNNSSLAEIKSDLIQHISELNLNIPTQDVNDLFEMYEQIENEEIYNY